MPIFLIFTLKAHKKVIKYKQIKRFFREDHLKGSMLDINNRSRMYSCFHSNQSLYFSVTLNKNLPLLYDIIYSQ